MKGGRKASLWIMKQSICYTNRAKEDSRRFWLSLGFVDKGMDEYDTPLMIKKDS